jgi:hypothetical protein
MDHVVEVTQLNQEPAEQSEVGSEAVGGEDVRAKPRHTVSLWIRNSQDAGRQIVEFFEKQGVTYVLVD